MPASCRFKDLSMEGIEHLGDEPRYCYPSDSARTQERYRQNSAVSVPYAHNRAFPNATFGHCTPGDSIVMSHAGSTPVAPPRIAKRPSAIPRPFPDQNLSFLVDPMRPVPNRSHKQSISFWKWCASNSVPDWQSCLTNW